MVSPLPTFCSASSRLPGAAVTPSLKTLSALVTVRIAARETGTKRASASATHEFLKIITTGLVECVVGGYTNTPPKQAFYRPASLYRILNQRKGERDRLGRTRRRPADGIRALYRSPFAESFLPLD